jgi:hypothetical protein
MGSSQAEDTIRLVRVAILDPAVLTVDQQLCLFVHRDWDEARAGVEAGNKELKAPGAS